MARLFGCKQNINISSNANLQRSQHLLSPTWSTSGLASFPGQVVVVTITMIVLIKKRHNNLLISGCFVLNTHTVFVLLVLDFNIYDSFHLNFSVSWAQHYSTQPTGEPTPQALFRFCKNLAVVIFYYEHIHYLHTHRHHH